MRKISKINIIIFILCIFLGIVLSTQMKRKVEDYTLVSINNIQLTKNQINNVNDEIEQMKALIDKKNEGLVKLKNLDKNDENIYDLITEELSKTKAAAGYMDMEGPGIVIKMEDNQDSEIVGADINDDVIHSIDILNVLNDLRVAGAEAISINGQRVLQVSEIKCGGPIIKVNGKSVGSPFIIKAIGDPKLLYASINAASSYGYTLKNVYKIPIESKIEDNIKIPAYSGKFSYRRAKPIKEGE